MDGRRLLGEIVQNFLCGNFSSMMEVLFLHNTRASYSSPFSFLLIISTTKQNIDPSRVNYQVRANYRSGIYQPERPERPER